MSHTDMLHLTGHFTDWSQKRAQGLRGIQPFLYYALEQVLTPFNLEDIDIRYGIIERGNDGGIDAFYFIANRNTLVRDDLNIASSGMSRVRLVIVQVNSSLTDTGFNALAVNTFQCFTEDLLNLSMPASALTDKYQPHLLTLMQTFKAKYSQIARHFPQFTIDYFYVTRGDETTIGPATHDAINNLFVGIKVLMPDAMVEFHPVNTQRLLRYATRRRTITRYLKWQEHPPLSIPDGFIGLVSIANYIEFLKDENGELNELLFDSNLRGYQKNTTVNKQIRKTLADHAPGNFWVLNNGITIISGGHMWPTKPMELTIDDPQIVNGLLTSRELFRYYEEDRVTNTTGATALSGRVVEDISRRFADWSVLVKVIRVTDDVMRDAIIKATNSQNAMNSAALRATDAIHRQIEASFRQFGLFYDRRRGFYKAKGESIRNIISITELVQAVVAIVLQRPDDARARPGDYISKTSQYAKVFTIDDSFPLSTYLKCILIVRRIDEFLDSQHVDNGTQRNVKFYLAYCVICDLTNRLNPGPLDVVGVEMDSLGDSVMDGQLTVVMREYSELKVGENPDQVSKGPALLARLKLVLGERIQGGSRLKKRA